MRSSPAPSFSLLHPTYHAPERALDVRETWLARAARPDLVEHIFAMDADDDQTIAATSAYSRVISPARDGEVTFVRNVNAAAASASGDLLFVIADDLYPPSGWDTAVRGVIGTLDPLKTAFAVKVNDNENDKEDTLLRHPVLSRQFYVRLGFFSPAFRGISSDNDLTIRAFSRAVIIDGREVTFEHRHPSFRSDVSASDSHAKMNQPDEYRYGAAALAASWTRRQREAPRILYHVDPSQLLSGPRLALVRYRYNVISTGGYVAKRALPGLYNAQRARRAAG
jgi:hypothetical protein